MDELPQNINIENSVDFYINEFATDGYDIYKKKLLNMKAKELKVFLNNSPVSASVTLVPTMVRNKMSRTKS